MSNTAKTKRSYGTGSLITYKDAVGRETWIGQWRAEGRQVKRRLGPKRPPGSREGLTQVQAEAEMRRQIAAQGPPRAGRAPMTLQLVSDRYVEHLKRQGRKPATIVAVRCALDNWFLPSFGTRALDRIATRDIEVVIEDMEAGRRPTKSRRKKPVGAKAIRNYIGTLSAIYKYAMHARRGWTTINPCESIELPAPVDDEEIHFLDPDEIRTLASCAVSGGYEPIDSTLYLVAAMTGLRQGELLALRWMDVDWLASRIRVRRNYVLGEFGTPKSQRSVRSVPMADEVARALDTLAKREDEEPPETVLVFGDPYTGEPLQRAALMRRYRRSLKAAELNPKHRFHDLRHTFGTRMAAVGVPMRTLQEWMGHRDIATTQRYADYAPSPAHERELVSEGFADRGTNRGTNLTETQRTS